MKKFLLAGLTGVLLAACGGSKDAYVKKGEISKTIDQEAVQKKYIEANVKRRLATRPS
jgi:hypothetical protein